MKVFVLNREMLTRATSVEEFARLYEEFKEFEEIDERFARLSEKALKEMLRYAVKHTEEFCK